MKYYTIIGENVLFKDIKMAIMYDMDRHPCYYDTKSDALHRERDAIKEIPEWDLERVKDNISN